MYRQRNALVMAVALGTIIGIQAFRAHTAQLVWNFAEDVPATTLGLVAIATWLPGFFGWIPAAAVGRSVAAWRLGILVAVSAVLRQTLWGEDLTPVLATATWVAWLWWVPALLFETMRRLPASLAAGGVLLGVSLEIASHTTLHGLEIHALPGAAGALAGGALSLAFLVALASGLRAPSDVSGGGAAWGGAALGPFLFVQLSLLMNVARLEVVSGWPPTAVVAAAAVSLVLAVVALTLPRTRGIVLGGGVLATAALAAMPQLPTIAPLLVIPAQAGLAIVLAGSFSAGGAASLGRAYAGWAGGVVLLFGLTFAFHGGQPVVVLWPIAAIVLTLVALRAARPEPRDAIGAPGGSRVPTLVAAALGLVAVVATALPAPAPAQVAVAPRAAGELRILNYNIHQGISRFGVPDLPAIAAIIEEADADLIGLQEVPRGWDVSGGIDALAYLRWRLPQYHVVYGPMHAEHFGNVVLSRFPMVDQGWSRFPVGPSRLPRGYVWATVRTSFGDVLFATTHLTPYDRADERTERAQQARALAAFSDRRERTIVVGDLNDAPGSAALREIVAGGLRDVLTERGVGDSPTYVFSNSPFTRGHTEKLDYILVSPDITTVEARILETPASDHLPLLATLRLR